MNSVKHNQLPPERQPDELEQASITPRMSLVVFAVQAALVVERGDVAGVTLMRLLGDLGLSASAARSVLLRMRRQGLLHSTPDGREARYRLSPTLELAQARLVRQLSGERPPWTGSFHAILYEVPETDRDFRDRLRRCAGLLGYVTLRRGLMIATSDLWDALRQSLPPVPAGAQLMRTTIAFSLEDSRQLAAGQWGLTARAQRYRLALATARDAIAAAQDQALDGPAALRAYAEIALPLYRTVAFEPDLPAELLPADWPGRQLADVISAAATAFWPSAGRYISELISHA